MLRALLPCTLAALLMAGCVGSSSPPEGAAGATTTATISMAAATGTTSSAPPAEPGAAPAPASTGPEVHTETQQWEFGVRAADQEDNFVGTGSKYTASDADGATAAVVEMAWTASSPASERLSMQVHRKGDGHLLGQASGASPLRVLLEGADAQETLFTFVRAADSPGVFAHQEVTLYTSFFFGAYDPAWTAVPA